MTVQCCKTCLDSLTEESALFSLKKWKASQCRTKNARLYEVNNLRPFDAFLAKTQQCCLFIRHLCDKINNRTNCQKTRFERSSNISHRFVSHTNFRSLGFRNHRKKRSDVFQKLTQFRRTPETKPLEDLTARVHSGVRTQSQTECHRACR